MDFGAGPTSRMSRAARIRACCWTKASLSSGYSSRPVSPQTPGDITIEIQAWHPTPLEVVLDVEHAFMAASTEPAFKEKFTIYSVDQLNPLVDHFAKYNCVSVCHFFGELCSEILGSPFKRKKTFS